MVISTHNIATGDGLYRAAAWAVLVRMYCDTVVVVAVAIGIVSVLFWNLLLMLYVCYVQLGQLRLTSPPRLDSKCGEWVVRFSDFGKYKGNIRNHSTSLPAYL